MARFVLIDHSLIDFSGHHFEYAQAVLNAASAAGFQPLLGANQQFRSGTPQPWPVFPVYKYGVWFHQGAPEWQQRLRRTALKIAKATGRDAGRADGGVPAGGFHSRCSGLVRSWSRKARLRRFMSDSRGFFDRLAATPDDIVFFPTVSLDEFHCLNEARRSGVLPPDGRWHIVFRRELPLASAAVMQKIRNEFESFAALEHGGPWRFWTDSEELAAQYERATGCPFHVLPIPHAEPSAAARVAGPFRILFLGDARREKGFHRLPDLVTTLTESRPRRFEFCFQSHLGVPAGECEIAAARQRLAGMSDRGVTLLSSPLSSEQYRGLLASGHLSLLLYDSAAYAARSSGVFAESLSAGIPTLVSAGTWMARRLPRDAGLVCQDATEAPALVRQIEADYERFAAGARAAAIRWREEHNAARLISLLTNSPS